MAQPTNAESNPSPTYTWVRSREWEGTYRPPLINDYTIGSWGISARRVGFGLGSVSQDEWPRQPSTDDWPPQEPPGLDSKAARRRIEWYLRAKSAADCLDLLSHRVLVTTDIRVNESWIKPKGGIVKSGSSTGEILGMHAVGLVLPQLAPFDVPPGYIPFLNSWGPKWGHGGWGLIHMDDLDELMVEAWAFPAAYGRFTPAGHKSKPVLVRNDFSLSTGHTIHRLMVLNKSHDTRIAWALALGHRNEIAIEDIFVRPEYRREGWGSLLLETMCSSVRPSESTIVVHVPHVDWYQDSVDGVVRFFESHRFSVQPSPDSWAACCAVQDGNKSVLPPPVNLPRPSFSLENEVKARGYEGATTRHLTHVLAEFDYADTSAQRLGARDANGGIESKKPSFEECLADILARRESALRRLAE